MWQKKRKSESTSRDNQMGKEKKRKVIFAVGGSGGHLFPAQTVAREMRDEMEILFVGAGLEKSRFFDRQRFAFQEISSATPFGKNPFKLLLALGSLAKGLLRSLWILNRFQPDLVIGFGSFHAFPVVIAALLKRIPFVQFESNAVPGKVNRLLSRFSLGTAIQLSEAAPLLRGKTVEVEAPVWKEEGITREEAAAYFSLDPHQVTLLAFGGSQGAAALNRHFCSAIGEVSQKRTDFQVLHFVGEHADKEGVKELYQKWNIPACVKAFEPRMSLAWTLSDFAVCRSGAMTIAELLAFEVPAILIPYPHAYDHQRKNALFIAEQAKGGVWIQESQLTAKKMEDLILDFLHSSRRKEMREALSAFKQANRKPQFSEYLCQILTSLESAASG
jgi:UDP-N-acetylglucosamine--N-acetylmuramyl-(pentapeptide) pyrophosphoryl-undecaprenol N-acetylglucosamine transferase